MTDRQGGLITGLSADSFQVKQDGAAQHITSFGEQDLPASIGVVFDMSGSMAPVLSHAKRFMRIFLDQCNSEDEGFLFAVSTRPDTGSDFTGDLGSLLDRTAFSAAYGATALTDTIYAAMLKSRTGQNPRKVLLIVSDGMDNHSRYSKSELLSAAVEADLQIYSISVFDPPRSKKPIELEEERQGVFFLSELSRKTGGLQIVVRGEQDFDSAARVIGQAIRNQYVIGYVPADTSADERWHTLRIDLNIPGAKAYSRPGFIGR